MTDEQRARSILRKYAGSEPQATSTHKIVSNKQIYGEMIRILNKIIEKL